MSLSIRLIHPTTRKFLTTTVSSSLQISEVAFQVCKEFGLHNVDIDAQRLVLSASSERDGTVLAPTAKLEESVPADYRPDKDSFEFQLRPVYVGVSVSDGGTVPLETRRLLLDYSAPLNSYYSHFQQCCLKLGNNEFVFQSVGVRVEWLNSNKSLADCNFEVAGQYLILYPIREVYKRFVQLNEVPEKTGFLWKQTGPDQEKLDKREKRYFVLTKLFLIYFKAKGDKEPSKVIPLDFHILKKKRDDKNHYTVSLRRVTETFLVPKGVPQVYILSTDDFKDDVNEWYDAMAQKCINTGERKVYGAPLLHCFDTSISKGRMLPLILTKTVGYLDQRGLEVEGIFRLAGSASLIEQYRDAFDLGVDVDLHPILDAHAVASLLKQWLRELPEPLLTFGLYESFVLVTADRALPPDQKAAKLMSLVHSLPEENMLVLKYLLSFLNRVSRLSDINKMNLQNLGTVFGPNLLRLREENMIALVKDTPLINEVTQLLIENESKLTIDTNAPKFVERERREMEARQSILPAFVQKTSSAPSISTQTLNKASQLPFHRATIRLDKAPPGVPTGPLPGRPAPPAGSLPSVPSGALPPLPAPGKNPMSPPAARKGPPPAAKLPPKPPSASISSPEPPQASDQPTEPIQAEESNPFDSPFDEVPPEPPGAGTEPAVEAETISGSAVEVLRAVSGASLGAAAASASVAAITTPIWRRSPIREGYLQHKTVDKHLATERWGVLTSTTLYFFKNQKEQEVGQPNNVIPLKGASVVKLDAKRFKIDPAFGVASILAFKSEQDNTDWLESLDTVTKRLSVAISSAESDVVEGEQEEQQWTQVVRIKKQEKRVSRSITQIEALENKLALEIAARQALEQHVRGLMQRIDALEQKLTATSAPSQPS